jgi:hypothetical protein
MSEYYTMWTFVQCKHLHSSDDAYFSVQIFQPEFITFLPRLALSER